MKRFIGSNPRRFVVIVVVALVAIAVVLLSQRSVQQALGFTIPRGAEAAAGRLRNDLYRQGIILALETTVEQKGTPRSLGFSPAPDEVWCVLFEPPQGQPNNQSYRYWEVSRVGLLWSASYNTGGQDRFRELGCTIG